MTPEQKTAILELAERLATQDNHGTAAPLAFNVMRPVAKYSASEDETGSGAVRGYWLDGSWCSEAETKTCYTDNAGEDVTFAKWLDSAAGWPCWRWFDDERYEHCGDFLTHAGCQQFIDRNRHHVGDKAYVYCNHAWRNPEMLLAVQMPAIIKQLLGE